MTSKRIKRALAVTSLSLSLALSACGGKTESVENKTSESIEHSQESVESTEQIESTSVEETTEETEEVIEEAEINQEQIQITFETTDDINVSKVAEAYADSIIGEHCDISKATPIEAYSECNQSVLIPVYEDESLSSCDIYKLSYYDMGYSLGANVFYDISSEHRLEIFDNYGRELQFSFPEPLGQIDVHFSDSVHEDGIDEIHVTKDGMILETTAIENQDKYYYTYVYGYYPYGKNNVVVFSAGCMGETKEQVIEAKTTIENFLSTIKFEYVEPLYTRRDFEKGHFKYINNLNHIINIDCSSALEEHPETLGYANNIVYRSKEYSDICFGISNNSYHTYDQINYYYSESYTSDAFVGYDCIQVPSEYTSDKSIESYIAYFMFIPQSEIDKYTKEQYTEIFNSFKISYGGFLGNDLCYSTAY